MLKVGQRVRYLGPSYTLERLFKDGYKNEAIITSCVFDQVGITFFDEHICSTIFRKCHRTCWYTSQRFIEPLNMCKQLHFQFT